MNRDAIRKHLEEVKAGVESVLDEYCTVQDCPCGYRQFVYWAGKKHGMGWQDNIQNRLIESALDLDCFEVIDNCANMYGLVNSYGCDNCGTKWNYISIEWRMLAFHKQLLIVGGSDPDRLYDNLISDDIFATAGREPDVIGKLSLNQWESFMLGKDFQAMESEL